MRVLIKNGLLIDPKNKIKEKLDVLIVDKLIKNISKNITEEVDHIIDADGFIVSPGFVDIHANFCDPGVTSREDLKSGSISAAKGGYTHVILGTENKPAPSECNVIDYIVKYSNIMPINLYPSGAVTEDRAGEDLADLQFLSNHGAYEFFDGLRPIEDKQLLKSAMLKSKSLSKIISIYSENLEKVKVRGILDTPIATSLSIKGATKITSEIDDLKENVNLAIETGAKVDFAYISSKESVELARESKENNKNLFFETQALSLILTDKSLKTKGTLSKVLPPLRSEDDRVALIRGLKKGIIDIVSSNHMPSLMVDKEEKMKDASIGAIGLEMTLGICGKILYDKNGFSWNDIIEKISYNPARIFELEKYGAGSLSIGLPANVVIFDPKEKWIVNVDNIASKSKNSPLIGEELYGKVKYTICNGKLVYKDINLIKE